MFGNKIPISQAGGKRKDAAADLAEKKAKIVAEAKKFQVNNFTICWKILPEPEPSWACGANSST